MTDQAKKKAKRVVMNLRAFNDLDHMAPVAFGLLSKGHEVLMLISSSELSANDKRLVWLSQEFPNCRVRVSRVGSLVRERLSGAGLHRKALRFLLDFIFIPRLRWGYNAYVFEWSEPSFAEKLHMRCRRLRVSAVPHGLNIFLNRDFTNHLRLSLTSVVQDRDNPDFSGRRVFTNYIVQSNEMLSLMSSWGLPESKIEILESPRFTYEWIEILDEVWGDEVAGAETRSMIQQGLPFFTFFLPHWTYNVDKDAVIGLLMRMRDSGLNCIIRTHTRRSGELTRSEIEMLSSENLVIDALTPSSVLIRHSTGVISFGTSVALEALARQVPVIHASHLHDNITIFDEMSEGLISVENNDKVMEEAIKILEARQSGQSKSRARPQVDERSLGEILGKYVEVICGEE